LKKIPAWPVGSDEKEKALNYNLNHDSQVPITPSNDYLQGVPGKYILCGEDDKDDEDFLKETFTNVDPSYTLIFVNNASKLLHMLRLAPDGNLPCLILLDYNMPEMNGAEILGEIKQQLRYEKVPKVIWSTSGSSIFRERCIGLGANEYLTKPSSVNEMITLAKHILSFC
jgi:CheY-like chemotaxis protein